MRAVLPFAWLLLTGVGLAQAALPRARLSRPAVAVFRRLLDEAATRRALGEMGFRLPV